MENTKMFLFARWISTSYSANISDGNWWKGQLKYFNEVVYPNYIKNGSVESTDNFLKDLNRDKLLDELLSKDN